MTVENSLVKSQDEWMRQVRVPLQELKKNPLRSQCTDPIRVTFGHGNAHDSEFVWDFAAACDRKHGH